MSNEKKGFWSKVFGPKKSSGCCSVKIEEVPDDEALDTEAAKKEKDEKAESEADQSVPAPCCAGARPKSGRGGGGCCG